MRPSSLRRERMREFSAWKNWGRSQPQVSRLRRAGRQPVGEHPQHAPHLKRVPDQISDDLHRVVRMTRRIIVIRVEQAKRVRTRRRRSSSLRTINAGSFRFDCSQRRSVSQEPGITRIAIQAIERRHQGVVRNTARSWGARNPGGVRGFARQILVERSSCRFDTAVIRTRQMSPSCSSSPSLSPSFSARTPMRSSNVSHRFVCGVSGYTM